MHVHVRYALPIKAIGVKNYATLHVTRYTLYATQPQSGQKKERRGRPPTTSTVVVRYNTVLDCLILFYWYVQYVSIWRTSLVICLFVCYRCVQYIFGEWINHHRAVRTVILYSTMLLLSYSTPTVTYFKTNQRWCNSQALPVLQRNTAQ